MGGKSLVKKVGHTNPKVAELSMMLNVNCFSKKKPSTLKLKLKQEKLKKNMSLLALNLPILGKEIASLAHGRKNTAPNHA